MTGMAFEATPAPARPAAADSGSDAVRAAWRVLAATRGAVLLVAIFAALSFGPASGGLAAENAQKFDEPALTHPLGAAADVLFSPLARWDARLVPPRRRLRVRRTATCAPPSSRSIRCSCAGWASSVGGSDGALLLAAYVISLAAFLGALTLLHRLAALELGTAARRAAR